jgi:hypothetical protein
MGLKRFLQAFSQKKTLGRGQQHFFQLQRIQIFTVCVACSYADADEFSLL